jgi:hypothetical protein
MTIHRAPGAGMEITRAAVALLASIAFAVTACGGDETADSSVTASAAAPTTPASTDDSVPIPATSATGAETSTSTSTSTTASTNDPSTPDDEWRGAVEAGCSDNLAQLTRIAEHDGTAEGIAARARALKAIVEQDRQADIALPASLREQLDQLSDDAVEHLDRSIALAEGGDVGGAHRAVEEGSDRFVRSATAIAIAGARCGFADPRRVENADLTVPLEMDPNQLGAGFGSIWVSEGLAGRVVRLDPASGTIQASVDVGDGPLKLQPADGRMWVRTAAAYVAIDPATNTVVATLAKADVGPAANRSWAVDGAMWICDGRRLHRYDPTTLAAVATLDLELDCNAVYATSDLVVAWSYNEDEPESGTSAAAFVDPATNSLLATVPMPVDVGGPALLPGAAFFHGYHGSIAVVVDLTTWEITATPDLGVPGGGTGQAAFDGESIYVVTSDEQDVLRVDGTTFAVTDVIEPLGANAVVVDDAGALWVARGQPYDVVQRFDVSGN